MSNFLDAIGGRKFAATLLALALGTGVELLKDGGLGEAYVMLLVGAIGVFSGANALVSWRGMEVGAKPASEPAELPPTQSEVEHLKTVAGEADAKIKALEKRTAALEQEQATQALALEKATKLIAVLMQRTSGQ